MQSGSQIGPYTIEREIGRGGMGVVYLARDTRLDRDVAIKSLPEHLAADPDRLARFEREARVLATLNHPNVAGIYGVEEQDGARYLILEYVEGETLADRLDRGSIPANDAIEIAIQIASGVEAAHEQGVIHRDLKPANIKFDSDGHVKVLDFGLARAEENSTTGSSMSQLPTLTTPAHTPTMAGVIMGTAAYMSPEQARGRKVDKRSDIWSFGVVFYEMLTGASPYIGETVSDSIGAILHKQVDLDRLPDDAPPIVSHLLSRCLRQNKHERYGDLSAVRIELEDRHSAISVTNSGGIGTRVGLILALLIAVVSLAFALTQTGQRPQPDSNSSLRFVIDPIPGAIITTGLGAMFDLSRDGRVAVFTANNDEDLENDAIWVRELEHDSAIELPDTGGAMHPRISPDGLWVAYFADDAIWKVDVRGGSPLRIVSVDASHRGLCWLDSDTIAFARSVTSPISIVNASGGTPREITSLVSDDVRATRSHRWPSSNSDGKFVVYANQPAGLDFDGATISCLDRETGQTWDIIENAGSYPILARDDTLLYTRSGTTYMVAVDLENRELRSEPRPILYSVAYSVSNGGANVAVSEDGPLMYIQGDTLENFSSAAVTIDFETGEGTPLVDEPVPWDAPRYSPDGTRVASQLFNPSSTGSSVIVYEIARGITTEIPLTGASVAPAWSPDGRWLAFGQSQLEFGNEQTGEITTGNRLAMIRANGEGDLVVLDEGGFQEYMPVDWHAGTGTLVYLKYADDTSWDLWQVRIDGAEPGEPEPLFVSPDAEWFASISPDGNWLAYVSGAFRDGRVYIRRLAGESMRTQISIEAGTYPAWAPDGNAIYFVADDQTLYRAALSARDDGGFDVDLPVEVVDLDIFVYGGPYPRISYHPDMTSALVLQIEDETARSGVYTRVITNWFDLIEKENQ
ncbi:MAG: protein kinase domain-containing protein [Planctomycetota bacterium]|jgi:serine/threonine-protein kinase